MEKNRENEIVKIHESILYPMCRVKSGNDGGSGTVIYSKKDPDTGEIATFLISNFHVIASAIKIQKVWNPLKQRHVNEEQRKTVICEIFSYNNISHNIGAMAYEADIICYDTRADLCILRLRDKENEITNIAKMFLGDINKIHIFDSVWISGCSLLHPPICNHGYITYLDEEIEGEKYFMTNAGIIYGNSGGAVFLENNLEFVGIPSRVAVVPGWVSQAVSFMGYFIPMSRIIQFFEEQDMQFLYKPEEYTIKQCFDAREKKLKMVQDKMELLMSD